MGSSRVFRSYMGSTDWNVGGLFAHDGYIFRLHDACMRLNIPFPIKYVFGSIPCRLQGGRIAPLLTSMGNARDMFEKYTSMGVGCRLTFSNCFITEEDLQDSQSNELLQELNELCTDKVKHGVIISSDLLAKYIKETYPKLERISSQVKPSVEVGLGNDTVEYYNALFDLYDVVVVNPFRAHDMEFLSKIKYLDRIEFIANHRCKRNCPLAKEHYETQMHLENELIRSNYANKPENKDPEVAKWEDRLSKINVACMESRRANPFDNSLISTSDIERLSALGVRHFKLEGRDYLGATMIRDIGHWIFNPDGIYLSLAQSLQGGPI